MSSRKASLEKSFKPPIKCTEGDMAIVIARIDKLQQSIDQLLALCLREEGEGCSSEEELHLDRS